MDKIFDSGSGCISVKTYVSLSPEVYDRISDCARDLDLSFESVLMAVVNTSVRRHFEQVSPDQEVQE